MEEKPKDQLKVIEIKKIDKTIDEKNVYKLKRFEFIEKHTMK